MKQDYYVESIQQVVDSLSAPCSDFLGVKLCDTLPPSRETLVEILDLIKSIFFPDFFGDLNAAKIRQYFIGRNIDLLFSLLKEQITRSIRTETDIQIYEAKEQSEKLAINFIKALPEIKRLLCTDIQAIYNNDPAVDNYGEVISCYPVVQAMVNYRVAHSLLQLGVKMLPRIITELAHSATGIDIHPGAVIGEYFAIDHGTGVVIGETCVIGHHVTLYQGVTLGAKNFSLDREGHPINIPRHPIIEDYVTIYSNSTILGRITIGHHSVIGGNVWLTHNVAPHSHILQRQAIATAFTDGLGI